MWLQSNAILASVSPVFMKKSLSTLAALTLVAPLTAFAQGPAKIGTVDMQRAFKEYNKTKEAEAKINDAKNAAKKEYDDRADAYKKALDEINNLNKQLESPALSADKKTGMAKERDDKIANIKSMEREISDFRQTRERQLQEQLMRMREGLVKEITDVVMEKVKAKNLDFVLDKSGVSINGVPVVMYAPDNVDFTNEIIETLNKPGRATASTASNKKTGASTSVTPAARPAKP
jgi:outer membrane protein